MLSSMNHVSSQVFMVTDQEPRTMALNEKKSVIIQTTELDLTSTLAEDSSPSSTSSSACSASSSPRLKPTESGISHDTGCSTPEKGMSLGSFEELKLSKPALARSEFGTSPGKKEDTEKASRSHLNIPSSIEPILAVSWSPPRNFITGLGTQYPPNLYTAADFDAFVRRMYDVEHSPGLQKLLRINHVTAIQTRAAVLPITHPFLTRPESPTIKEIDAIFNQEGVALAAAACRVAMSEAGIKPSDITHMVSVTSNNFGVPGYDFHVAQALGLPGSTDRALIAGTGCAGGLAALRTATNIANGASAKSRGARVLVVALEMSSLNVRRGLDETKDDAVSTSVAPVLFGDGAAAMVVCNDLAIGAHGGGKAVYELLDSGCEIIPNSLGDMRLDVNSAGFSAHIGKNVPMHAVSALPSMLTRMLPSFTSQPSNTTEGTSQPAQPEPATPLNVDWALHPGGIAIIKGAQIALGLTDEQLRATYEVYGKKGNTAAVTVFSVLDSLRKMGQGRDNVVAAAFGPGMMCEMATLRRYRG